MTDEDAVLKELQDIKKLIMLLLARDGATSAEIGKVLALHPGTVRKMVPMSGGKSPRS